MTKSPVIPRNELISEAYAALPPEYQLVNPDGSKPVDVVTRLGEGGSSVVFRAQYRERLDRAVKVVIPRDDLRAAVDLHRFVESYYNEVSQLANLRHENISKITDFGYLTLGADEYPYIATEFIEGSTLLDFCKLETTRGEEILSALENVLSALDYMHRNGVMHCDLKPENILVTKDALASRPASATVVDLGASRYFSKSKDNEAELVYFYSTPRYVHPDLQYVVSNRTNNRIERRNLRKYFPQQDLYSFGVVLEDLLEVAQVKAKLSAHVGLQYVSALSAIRDRLVKQASPARVFASAREVAESFKRIAPSSISVFEIPELSLVPQRGVVIPAFGSRVSTSSRIDTLISHPLFQRLHLLPQLDMLHYVLPGATHSRFVHALHTYDLVRQGILHLLGDWRFRLEVERADIEATLVAGIASQLGQYHFLHMFEDFIAGPKDDERVRSILRDDKLLDEALAPGTSELGDFLGSIQDSSGRTMRNLLEAFGMPWGDVRQKMTHPSGPLQGVLAALTNSPVDAEKLSYLFDDSSASGVPFGRAVTGAPIFESVVIPSRNDWERQGAGVSLGVRERSISYLEHGVLARYWNIQAAYWNRTNRSVQTMIKFVIRELIVCGQFNFTDYVRETIHLSSDGALRWLNDRFEAAQRANKISSNTVNPIAPLILSQRGIYKRLVTISTKSRIDGRKDDHKVYENVRSKSPLDDQKVVASITRALTSLHPELKIAEGEILLDLPRERREDASGKVLIYTDDGSEFMGDLFSISPLLQQQRESFELNVKRMRVFLHPRLYEELSTAGQLAHAYDSCLDTLRGEWGQ